MFKKFCIVSIVIMFLTISVSSCFATSFVSAWVTRTRTTDGIVDVMLKYESGNGCEWSKELIGAESVWFDSTFDSMDNQTLAIALTAISLGKTVRVGIEQCPNEVEINGTYSSIGLDQ